MDSYIDETVFSKLLHSLSVEIKKYYPDKPPILVGVGMSGLEVVGRLQEYFDPEIDPLVCDVKVNENNEVIEVMGFPESEVKGKDILICYTRVDTGGRLEKIGKKAIKAGVNSFKTLSVVVRENARIFPNFYSFMVRDNDNPIFLLDNFPSTLPNPFPQVNLTCLNGFIRKFTEVDLESNWFKSGEDCIDKFLPDDYYYQMITNNNTRIYVIDNGEKIIGIVQITAKDETEWCIDVLAIDVNEQKKGYGPCLLNFVTDLCRFNGVKYINLYALERRVPFYEKKFFKIIKKIKLSRSNLIEMRRKVF
ncbi:MAG: GNAT family N-acetyltransferase [Candidatus Methanoperedens sp.]|nr:GNAT family N-acetyltransferase [Candidatus Methanoperedens sp.]